MTTTTDMAAQVTAIVARELHVHVDQVTPEAELDKDLGADMLDVIGLIVVLEEDLQLRIEDDAAIDGARTVADLIALAEAGGAAAAEKIA